MVHKGAGSLSELIPSEFVNYSLGADQRLSTGRSVSEAGGGEWQTGSLLTLGGLVGRIPPLYLAGRPAGV